MQKQLEQYFGCKVKIAEYKNKLQLPIFMTMCDIMMVEIYGVNFAIIDVVKEMELNCPLCQGQANADVSLSASGPVCKGSVEVEFILEEESGENRQSVKVKAVPDGETWRRIR